MTRSCNAWVAALACALACGCGQSSSAGSAQGQTHWLAPCASDFDCGGLACICGVCIAACAPDGSCSVEDRVTLCEMPGSASTRALCGDVAPPLPICLEPCNAGCAGDERCLGGSCIPESRVQPSGQGGSGQPLGGGGGSAGSGGAGGGAGGGGAAGGGAAGADSGVPDAAVVAQDAGALDVACTAQPPRFPSFGRSCSDAADCAVGTRVVNCCGGVVKTGVRADELERFQAAAGTCASQFPLCGCAASVTFADDGSTANPGLDTAATVQCIDSMCQTTFLQGATTCGATLTCDGPTQICVVNTPVGPSQQWSCQPVPAGCGTDRNCACASALCVTPFAQCYDSGGLNSIDCICPGCQ